MGTRSWVHLTTEKNDEHERCRNGAHLHALVHAGATICTPWRTHLVVVRHVVVRGLVGASVEISSMGRRHVELGIITSRIVSLGIHPVVPLRAHTLQKSHSQICGAEFGNVLIVPPKSFTANMLRTRTESQSDENNPVRIFFLDASDQPEQSERSMGWENGKRVKTCIPPYMPYMLYIPYGDIGYGMPGYGMPPCMWLPWLPG